MICIAYKLFQRLSNKIIWECETSNLLWYQCSNKVSEFKGGGNPPSKNILTRDFCSKGRILLSCDIEIQLFPTMLSQYVQNTPAEKLLRKVQTLRDPPT